MKEWEEYKVSGEASQFNRSCMEFSSIYHTSHIGHATGIVETGAIKPSLVYDDSKLNTKRILVSWLSPNHWGRDGYRYGNVRFSFSLKDMDLMSDKKKLYWVEVKRYKIRACRILITDKDRGSEGLKEYDPFTKNGPWWYDQTTNKHYYNNHCCLEFMFEDSVPVTNIATVDFVDHSNKYCNLHRRAVRECSEFSLSAAKGGARFLSRLAASDLNLRPFSASFIVKDDVSTASFHIPFNEIFTPLTFLKFTGPLTYHSDAGKAVAKAILNAYSYNRNEEVRALAALFSDVTNLGRALASVLCGTIGYEKWFKFVNRHLGLDTDDMEGHY